MYIGRNILSLDAVVSAVPVDVSIAVRPAHVSKDCPKKVTPEEEK